MTVSAASSPRETEAGTRQRVLALVTREGPISAAELAARLRLTSAGIRRHVAGLEAENLVAVHEGAPAGGRGRPARRYVATDLAQESMSGAYTAVAVQALEYLAEVGGDAAIDGFVERHVAQLEDRYAPQITGESIEERAGQLADALAADGYAASVRPVPGTLMMQLCQGHCPVQHVAARFPQICDAEARTFSRLLGSHVQRLVTLAGGAHVCTTNIPVTRPSSENPTPAGVSGSVEGTR
ncbi:transcriptional regulator [Flavimobilis marinus]|uniref:Predicted transcriptional regulator, ArsR family n=1 Tax=Flavimobilis marinus TaxID=285351 RepID=A0A1I2F0H3_9MICO|nr:MarR family transcriptional regulator [Flavimobilis marinus]GHG53613.1 transcriptional regulator [Flavimobilis marinus]SFE98188.1 Predicted transcriptional regulator, ArsR family [Flavimobilis marinus]